jgi:hypothetical protein
VQLFVFHSQRVKKSVKVTPCCLQFQVYITSKVCQYDGGGDGGGGDDDDTIIITM